MFWQYPYTSMKNQSIWQTPASKGTTYLFIDGAYVQKNYADGVTWWFGDEAEIDIASLTSLFPAEKTFYYDCRVIQKDNESEVGYQARKEKQDAYFNRIRELDNLHIKLGTLVKKIGKRAVDKERAEQKGVDVLLAVDVLTHAARQNIDKVILISGNRDFKPLVESLVGMGLSVQLVSDPKTTAPEFAWVADSYRKLTFNDYYLWTSESLREKYPRADSSRHQPDIKGASLIKSRSLNGNEVNLYQSQRGHFIAHFPVYDDGKSLYYSHEDCERLELYIATMLGKIALDKPKKQ
jgi:uncharacterized LabA/DUF88 family protein